MHCAPKLWSPEPFIQIRVSSAVAEMFWQEGKACNVFLQEPLCEYLRRLHCR